MLFQNSQVKHGVKPNAGSKPTGKLKRATSDQRRATSEPFSLQVFEQLLDAFGETTFFRASFWTQAHQPGPFFGGKENWDLVAQCMSLSVLNGDASGSQMNGFLLGQVTQGEKILPRKN